MRTALGIFALAWSLLAFAIGFGACTTPRDQVDVDNIAPAVGHVLSRYEAYVANDAKLTATERGDALGDSAMLAGLMKLDVVARVSLEPSLSRVLARHDAYVLNDATLSIAEREVYVASSDALRTVLRPPD